jgi:hypothetical protein
MDHCLCKGEVYANIIKILDPCHRILPNSSQFSLGEFSDIKERCRRTRTVFCNSVGVDCHNIHGYVRCTDEGLESGCTG